MAPTPLSNLEDPSVVDLIFSDEDTLELPPGSSMVEVVDTDTCAEVRFPEEIPDQVLEAYLRHHSSGQGSTCPDVLSWCLDRFREMYPDAPCVDFDFTW